MPLRVLILLLCSHCDCHVHVQSSLSRIFSCGTTVSLVTVNSSLTQLVRPVSRRNQLLSKWIRLLISFFRLLHAHMCSLANYIICVKKFTLFAVSSFFQQLFFCFFVLFWLIIAAISSTSTITHLFFLVDRNRLPVTSNLLWADNDGYLPLCVRAS